MKNLAVCLATCGLIFASCSNNDVFEENNDIHSQDNINFSANTTRAIINGLDQVKGGFKVYATENGKTPWFINGDTYKFEEGKWDWPLVSGHQTIYSWPTTAAGYPMNFYAFYPINDPKGFSLNSNKVGTVTADITIEADPINQTDFLAANYENVTTKPASGKLNLKFGHITSKVNFSVIAGIGANVFVQQIHMQNVGNTGTYRYNSVTTEGVTDPAKWTSSLTGGTLDKYKYFPTVSVPGTTKALPTFTPPTADETTKNPVYTTETNRHLMLRPQTTTATWTGTKTDPAAINGEIKPTNAYIESVYRIEANGDVNAVGYKSAADHPDYKADSYSGPLFIKVGFPLGTSLTWDQGKGYMYSLKLGTVDATGGIIIDDNYYDDKGNRTDLTIKDKEPGDPVNDGDIHFNVDVTVWGDDLEGAITQ